MNVERSKKGKGMRLLVLLPLIALCILIVLIAVPLFAFGYVDAILHGPKIVLSVPSPDGNYEAYVEEAPSIDPPNQSLFVERSNRLYFMHIADLAEDIDSIKQILWSPDSRIVVFHSQYYLTAARVSDWQTVRIYLGKEWRRSQPRHHHTTFTSGGVSKEVKTIEFPQASSFAYQLVGNDKLYTVDINSLVRP